MDTSDERLEDTSVDINEEQEAQIQAACNQIANLLIGFNPMIHPPLMSPQGDLMQMTVTFLLHKDDRVARIFNNSLVTKIEQVRAAAKSRIVKP